MTKIAIASDLHVFAFSEFAVGDDRLRDCISVLSDIRVYCQEHAISCLVLGGDLFHKPGVLHTKPYNLVVKELAALQDAEIEVFCIPGNHDMSDKAGQEHAVEALHRAGLVHGLIKASYKTWRHQGVVIQGFPYCDSKDEFARRVEAAHASVKGPRIGIFHHGFKGAKVGTHLEYQVKEELSAKRLLRGTEFNFVCSGHYHHHQRILGRDDAWYIGSPLEHSRASKDCVSEKGFLVYDAEKNSFELVPLRRSKFVLLTQEELDAKDFSAVEKNFVDVEWTEYPGGKERLEKHLKEAGARAWKLLTKKKSTYEVKDSIDPLTSPAEAIKDFLQERRRDMLERGLKPKKVVRLALELLQKAAEED